MTFTEERIFEIRRVDSHSGIKVLYTPFPITREFIPQELNVYSLIKKINGGFFVGEIAAETNLVDLVVPLYPQRSLHSVKTLILSIHII